MGYRDYVIAAYFVFAVVLVWDYVAPRVRTHQLMRATRLLAARRVAAASAASRSNDASETPGELHR